MSIRQQSIALSTLCRKEYHRVVRIWGQTILPPVHGEHLGFGDTGVVIYSNAVLGARSNFEGGPSALSAGLTGRTPRYGYHLDRHRIGTRHFAVSWQPKDFSDWGALGGNCCRRCRF